MENIKLYELEETYHSEKSSFEYPTVSYTKDTDKVWYMKNNQIKMMFSITEDDVNNYNGEDLMVWENSVLFDSVKVDGVEQKVPLQEKNVIITGETSEEVIVDITLENSVTQGEVVLPQPMSMTIEEEGNNSSELPYIINITDENKLPYSSGKITVKLTNTSLNNLSYRPSFYVKYASTIEVEDMIERTEYALLDWYTAQEVFSMLVNDDGTEMTLTLPSEINITHLFIVPMDSSAPGDIDASLEPQVEGIYLDENYLLYSYETNNIILPCQLICGGGFILDESCYINDQNIKKCNLIFNEPISEEKAIDMDKYFLTILFQGYNDGMWINYENFTQPLSVFIEEGMTDVFIVNEKSELVGLDLYYCSGGLVNYLGPTARMLAHVVYDENAVYDEENNNFIVNVNEETLVGSYIKMIIGGVPLLSLPTTEVKNYEVVATKYNDVTDMRYTFSDCSGLTSLDLSNFDTSKVTNMYGMFYRCKSLTTIIFGDKFDTSKVTDMSWMFYGCKSLISLDLSNFNTSNVTDMGYMFNNCSGLTSLDLSNFDTSNVTDMYSMFNGCSGLTSLTLTSDISNIPISDLSAAFSRVSSNLTIYHASVCDLAWYMGQKVSTELANATFVPALKSDWELTYITSTISPTSTTTSYKLIGNLNVVETMSINGSAITPTVEYTFSEIGDYTIEYGFIKDSLRDTRNMFYNCSGLTSLDLSNLDTSKVTDMSSMFSGCRGLTSLDLSNFNTSNVTYMSNMFYNCSGLTSITFGDNFDTSNVTNMNTMFWHCESLTSLDLSSFDTSNVTSMYGMFYSCDSLTSLDLSSFDTSNVTSMSEIFVGCNRLTSITFGNNFDTSNVTSMRYMFFICESLTSLDLSNFNTSNVTNMLGMFSMCKSLTSLDLSNFNTSNVTDMSEMFNNCSGLTSLNLSNFNTSHVTTMEHMFWNCESLTSLDLSNFDTSNVTDMNSMFNSCGSLTSLDLSNFNTSKVTNMNNMFSYCRSLTSLDLSNFNTSNVAIMGYMFGFCNGLTSLDLSSFDTSKVTNMSSMFDSCSGLTSVTFGSQADVSKVTSHYLMFYKITTTGTLYYPSAYATAWNRLLVTNQSSTMFPSSWTAVPIDYE